MAAPPPYDESQKYNGGGGPPGFYPQQPGQPRVMLVNHQGLFGKVPVTTTCPNCQANVSNGGD